MTGWFDGSDKDAKRDQEIHISPSKNQKELLREALKNFRVEGKQSECHVNLLFI